MEQQEEAVVEEVSNAEDAATEVTEEVEAAPEETSRTLWIWRNGPSAFTAFSKSLKARSVLH